MPLFVVECSDVKALSNSQINQLRCGDYLVKKDASGEHAYKVTFKKEGVGMCLTYHDASVIETQSYDYVDGNWVYNSEDKTPILLDDIVEGLEDKDVEVKTIHQSQPNYSLNFSFETGVSGVPTGITITNIYNKFIQYGNILYVVGNFLLENTTEASISITSLYKPLTLSADVASKIFDYGGKKVSEDQTDLTKSDVTLLTGYTGINNVVSATQKIVAIRHVGVNTIQFEIGYGTSIAAGGKNAFTFRGFLVLE